MVRPAGKVSVRAALSVAAGEFAFALASVIVRVLETPAGTLAGAKALVMVGTAPTDAVPFRRNALSGPPAVGTQLVFTAQVLLGQPNPPPGFWNAAGLFEKTVRS